MLFAFLAQQDASGAYVLDLSALAVKIVLAVFLGALVMAMFRGRLSHAIETALIWVVIALLLAVGYTYRFELRDVADRVMAELLPGHAATRGRLVEIARGAGGNFNVMAQINGA